MVYILCMLRATYAVPCREYMLHQTVPAALLQCSQTLQELRLQCSHLPGQTPLLLWLLLAHSEDSSLQILSRQTLYKIMPVVSFTETRERNMCIAHDQSTPVIVFDDMLGAMIAGSPRNQKSAKQKGP